MSEVPRFKVVKMLSEDGNRISYDPHGPEVVMASAFDRLKAENAGLRTGYQAYERVNAELKAEMEKLRKDAERYRWLRANNYYAHVQVMEADGSMPYLYAEELDFSIDAAMGKGEQS